MKKVILGAAALMFTAVGFAQVSGSTTPTTLDPTEAQDQRINGGLGNYGESVQNGNNHKVRVRQAGEDNSVYTNQSDGATLGGNLADVIQTGNVDGDPNSQSGYQNRAETVQIGAVNESRTWQQGDYNDAQTLQGTNDDTSSGNLASIQQGNANNAENNDAMIMQDGTDNEAKTFQTYDNSQAFTTQEGTGNESYVRQIANPNASVGHYAFNDQDGDENNSTIEQSGSADQAAYTLQVGDNNDAWQDQSSGGIGASGDGNTALINQGVQTEYGTIRNVYGPLLRDTVDDWTEGGVNGDGSFDAHAYQLQTGLRNNAEIHQYGQVDGDDSDNEAGQEQHGDDNEAMIVQNAYGNDNGGSNYAYQIQTENSSGNVAALAQNGNDHKAFQWQDGSNSQVLSTQRGRSNKLSTYQMDSNNFIETAQRGQNNAILITQDSAGNSYTAHQNVPGGTPVGMPNSGNQIDVYQTGPGMDDFSGDDNPNDCFFGNEVLTNDPMAPLPPSNPDICQGC